MIVTNLQAMQTPWGQSLNYALTYVKGFVAINIHRWGAGLNDFLSQSS